MSFEIVDPKLEKWASSRGLHIYSEYRDEEVRSIDVVSPTGKRFQIWLDPPASDGRTIVHVWDYRRRRKSIASDLRNLESQLERAYCLIQSWF